MLIHGLQMVAHRVIVGFARLGHHIADEYFNRALIFQNRLGQLGHQQIRNDARVQASRSDQNRIGFPDRLDSFR
ncbi:hypothetical protein D3C73_1575350 [compost metagenome]